MSILEKYGYGLRPNALATDAGTYDTSNVLAGMPKTNALADALRVAGVAPQDEHGFLFSNVGGELKFNPYEAVKNFMAYRAPPGALSTSGDDTPVRNSAEAAGWLGLSGLGLNFAGQTPKNAIGVFGGRIAANRLADNGVTGPRSALAMAESMHAKGASLPEIRSATNAMLEREAPEFGGVHMGRDGRWRFEIDDRDLAYSPSADWRPATEHFPHKVFEQAYPEARSIDSMVATGNGIKSAAGYVEDLGTPNASMMVRTPTPEQARRIAAHEFQHVAQAAEGFDFGSSPAAVMRSPLYGQFVDEVRQSPTYRNASPEAQKAAEQELAKRLYTYLAGEVEAENVAGRMTMSPEQRRAIPPSETARVPERSQFLLRDLWPE